MSIAGAIGASPTLFALMVAISTSSSFIIPTLQVNALITRPTAHKLIDFVERGDIKTILVLIASPVVLKVLFSEIYA